MDFVAGFLLGVLIGAAVAILVGFLRGRAGQRLMREAFAAIAGEALDANSRRISEQAAATLIGTYFGTED